MTEVTEPAAVTANEITDEKVTEYFDNGGSFNEEPKEPIKEVVKETPKEEPKLSEEDIKKREAPVNYGALHEERQRRKEVQAELAELKKWKEEFERAKNPEPTFEEDPVEVLRRENEQIKGVLTAQYQSELNKQQDAAYRARLTEGENAFKVNAPDFDDAIKFLASSRLEELKDLGFSEKDSQKTLADEIRWIANNAWNQEANPAERFYNLAKRRGFKTETAPDVNEEINKKLANIEKGIKTNKQLPPASKSVSKDLTAQELADMDVNDPAFASGWEKLFGKSA